MCQPVESLKIQSTQNELDFPANRRKYSGRSTFAQILATLIQNWLLIEIGLDWAMPTMVIGALHKNPAEALNMNDDQASWFGSIPSICHPLASLSSGYLQELLGRKTAMILVTIPTFAAWMTLYFAQSIHALYAVAAIMGLCTGLTEAPLHSYIGEIGEPHLRGTLSTISQSAGFIGVFMMYAFCYIFDDWRTIALICSVCPVITFTSMTQIPESPTWLIVRDRLDDARKSLCWLRGWLKPEEVEEEFQALRNHARKSVSASNDTELIDDGPHIRKSGYLRKQFKEMASRKVLLPLRMVCIVFVISAFAGYSGIKPYLIGELKKLDIPIDSKLVLIAFQVLVFVGAMLNVVFLRRFGKRKLALLSYGILACCILGIAAYRSFLQGSERFPQLAWLPVIFWLTLGLFGGLGPALLPWQLVSEVFPIVGRGLASGFCSGWKYVVAFFLVKTFLYIEAWIGLSGVTYLYGIGASSVSSTFTSFCPRRRENPSNRSNLISPIIMIQRKNSPSESENTLWKSTRPRITPRSSDRWIHQQLYQMKEWVSCAGHRIMF
ncbi:unnamed protein product [Bemisia tabaci]|nr:unnamed protein product [Bemisia tabaci]